MLSQKKIPVHQVSDAGGGLLDHCLFHLTPVQLNNVPTSGYKRGNDSDWVPSCFCCIDVVAYMQVL